MEEFKYLILNDERKIIATFLNEDDRDYALDEFRRIYLDCDLIAAVR